MYAAAKAYQKDTAGISRSIAEAHSRAVQDLQDDAARILDTYTRAGGFRTRAEAEAYLNQPMSDKERQVLIDRAYETYKGKRLQQELVRLSGPAYQYRITRKEGIRKSAQMAAKRLQDDAEGRLSVGLDSTVVQASKRTGYDLQKQVGVAVDMTLPNRQQIDQVQRGTGVYHKVKLWSEDELKTARTTITEGILSGRKLDEMQDELADQCEKAPYVARRLVRTTMAQAAADEAEASMKRMDVKRYRIVCTADERLCPLCAQYDGMICPVGKGPMPTFHPNCRCTIAPYIEDDERRAEVEKRREERRGKRRTEGTALETTRRMTYAEWQAKYTKEGVDSARREFRAQNAARPASMEVQPKAIDEKPPATVATEVKRIGNRWIKPNSTEVRYYVDRDDFARQYMHVDYERDRKGRIEWATVDGRDASKSEANRVLSAIPDKLWYDEDGILHYYTTFGESDRFKDAVAALEAKTKAEALAKGSALKGLERDGYRITDAHRMKVWGGREYIMYDLRLPNGNTLRDVRAGRDEKGLWVMMSDGKRKYPPEGTEAAAVLEELVRKAESVKGRV